MIDIALLLVAAAFMSLPSGVAIHRAFLVMLGGRAAELFLQSAVIIAMDWTLGLYWAESQEFRIFFIFLAAYAATFLRKTHFSLFPLSFFMGCLFTEAFPAMALREALSIALLFSLLYFLALVLLAGMIDRFRHSDLKAPFKSAGLLFYGSCLILVFERIICTPGFDSLQMLYRDFILRSALS